MTAQLNYAEELIPSDSPSGGARAGDMLSIVCTVAGDVRVYMNSGGDLTFRVEIGQSFMPIAVSRVYQTGTTAVARYYNLVAK